MERLLGGVELGGTKVVCAYGRGPHDVELVERAPTTGPEQTLGWAVAQLRSFEHALGPMAAIGIASFGPLDLRPGNGPVGRILRTPKPAWSDADIVAPFREAFGVPVAVASDVEGAALAEAAVGAGRGLRSFAYVTVGTGIGVGVMAGGALVRGLLHPELGHIAVPRQPDDDYEGSCPYHGDCWEGLASGPAMAARWGAPAHALAGGLRDRAMELEAAYLAAGFRAIAYAYLPERIVVGGGVGLAPGLLPAVAERLVAELRGYPGVPELQQPGFVA
ncbi:MAG: ROK family protein, partial [Actinomycetota bacterium]